MKEIQTYPGVNPRTAVLWILILMLTVIAGVAIWLLSATDSTLLRILLLLVSLISPFLIVYTFSTKVILTSDRLIKKSIIGIREIRFQEIKSHSLYEIIRHSATPVSKRDIDNRTWWIFAKIIFVSPRANHNPNSMGQKGTIRFHYNKDLYRELKKRIIASS
jgi:hypothetical protein